MNPRKLLLTLSILLLSGCGAVQSQQGETLVFSNVPTKGIGLLLISIVLIVLGVGLGLESWRKTSAGSGRGKSKSGKSRKSTKQPAGTGGVVGLIVGVGLAGLGAFLLLLGVPSAFLASVRVEPDRVILRDDLLWFSGVQEVPFDQLAAISKEEYEVVSRYRTRVEGSMYLRFQDGHQQTIKMSDIHKLAYDPLVSALADFQAKGTAESNNVQHSPATDDQHPPDTGSGETVANGPSIPTPQPNTPTIPNESPAAIDTSNLTPVEHLSYIFPGIEIRSQAKNVVGRVLAVYREGQVLVRPKTGASDPVLIPLAAVNPGGMGVPPSGPGTGPGSEVNPASPPPANSIVLAYYQGRWFEAKLISAGGNRCTIAYVGRERSLEGVGLSAVRVPGPEGTAPHVNRRFAPPTESLQPAPFAGSWSVGRSAFLLTESEEPMTVAATYANGMIQLSDATGATLFAHWTELKPSR
ncbi:MAG: hypothetical protein KDA66_16240 [Planctomycetaceae bacterium]|nr:hypothetical protein [Planctomycetaceae bacterium]